MEIWSLEVTQGEQLFYLFNVSWWLCDCYRSSCTRKSVDPWLRVVLYTLYVVVEA